MELIDDLGKRFERNQFEFSKHAVDRIILRHILVREVREAVQNGKVIEEHPDDKYGPTCLILGFTRRKRPLHIQCSYPSRSLVKVITVYEPDPDEWIDFKVRIT